MQINITAGLCSLTFCGFELLSPQRVQERKDLEHKHKHKHKHKGHELSVARDHIHFRSTQSSAKLLPEGLVLPAVISICMDHMVVCGFWKGNYTPVGTVLSTPPGAVVQMQEQCNPQHWCPQCQPAQVPSSG